MFELNKDIKINKYFVEDSLIFTIDNFYKNPDKIVNLFLEAPFKIHKKNIIKSYNMVLFEDNRHIFKCEELTEVNKFLSGICGQKTYYREDLGFTNFTRFKKDNFNDYHNNYWWPHKDGGYNGIVYFNKNDIESGTNLYKNLDLNDPPRGVEEHQEPWRSKSKYTLIHQIKPKYNRMVLFDGFKFFHGMNICNNEYFDKIYRMNQIFFFEKNINHKQIQPPKNLKRVEICI